MNIIVLAGGGGTRLWPLSRQDFPKQFLHFGDHLSLLQKTVGRFLRAPFVKNVMVATNHQYLSLVETQLKKIAAEKRAEILLEPVKRNTAPAIAIAVKYLQERQGITDDDVILVMPSDHLIEPESVFLRFIEDVQPMARDQIVLFGIRPTRPETGYGYIQIGEKHEGSIYQVKRFVEKPDRQRAEQYLASHDYYWNAGIFTFCPRVFWQEIKQYAPEIEERMRGDYASCLEHFAEITDVSFDYAVLEKTKKVAICPMPISWSDVGSWDSLYDALAKDQNQNVKMGNVLDIDTRNSLIIGGKKLISTIGMEDVLIVETDDATFISKKGESQKVKELVQELVKIGRKEVSNSSFHQYQWGKVKLLYKGDGFQVDSYQISDNQSFMHEIVEQENWMVLEGTIEFEWKGQHIELSPSKSFQFTELGLLKIKNTKDQISDILLTTFSR